MYGKVQITGIIELKTGLHIGGSSAFSGIGAIDSPVIRDVLTNLPFIPGSTLKGKMRYLLNLKYDEHPLHEKHDEDPECVTRLFGAGSDSNGNPIKSRLYFSDAFISNIKDMEDKGIPMLTEVKFENTINRLTAVANPRQIERVIRGTQFSLEVIYNYQNISIDEIIRDLKLFKEGLDLLEIDYIGGHGSRGYGRVAVLDESWQPLVGDLSKEEEKEIRQKAGW